MVTCKECDEPVKFLGLCKKHYARDYYKRNKEIMKESTRRWQEKNPEKVEKYKKDFYTKNPGYAARKTREWKEKNGYPKSDSKQSD